MIFHLYIEQVCGLSNSCLHNFTALTDNHSCIKLFIDHKSLVFQLHVVPFLQNFILVLLKLHSSSCIKLFIDHKSLVFQLHVVPFLQNFILVLLKLHSSSCIKLFIDHKSLVFQLHVVPFLQNFILVLLQNISSWLVLSWDQVLEYIKCSRPYQ